MVTVAPEISRIFSNLGIAVISLLLSSTATCPSDRHASSAHALTRCSADFRLALSRDRRSVLPSMFTTSPAKSSQRSFIQPETLGERIDVEHGEHPAERVVRR